MDDRQTQKLEEFNCLCREMDGLYHELAVRAGMSDSAFYILYAIVEMGDGCLQKDISERYSFSKQTINSSIQNLRSKGYITLEQGKGRDKHIHFTDAGKQFAEDSVVPVMEMENEVFQEMPPQESQELLRLMKKYIQIFQKKTEQNSKTMSSEDF